MSSNKAKRTVQKKREEPKPPADNLVDLFDELRTGAANVAGVTFQVALSAFLLATGRADADPDLPVVAVRPEGFEDIDCELADGAWLFVQAKERGLEARNIAAAELAEILAHAAQALRLTDREIELKREQSADEYGHATTGRLDGSRTGSGDCRLAVVTNGSFGSSLPVTGWTQTLEAALAEPDVPTKVAESLLTALETKLAAIGLKKNLARFILSRAHLVVAKEGMGQATTALLESGLAISPTLASVVRPHLICDLTEVAAAQREKSRESAVSRSVQDLDALAARWARTIDVASLEEAVRAGVCEPVDFLHPSGQDAQTFYAGVGVSPGHIAAGLDVVRPLESSRVVNGLAERGQVVIAGPSGSGKSALLWRSARLLEAGPRLVRVLRVADSADAGMLVNHVLRSQPTAERAVVVCVDDLGRPKTAAWSEARDRLLEVPGVKILGAARREDLSPALSKGAELVDATLTASAATQVYQAIHRSGLPLALAQEEAVGKADGLLMEFIALATTGRRLREVLADQLAALSVPGRHLDRSLLRLICAAHTLGFEIAATALSAQINQPEEQVSDALRRLDGEHLATSADLENWRALHDLRAEVLLELLHTAPPPTLASTYALAISALPGPARPAALRRAAVRVARPLSEARSTEPIQQRLDAINRGLLPLARCLTTQIGEIGSSQSTGSGALVAGLLEAADRLDSVAQVYASLPLVKANAKPGTDLSALMLVVFFTKQGIGSELPGLEHARQLAAQIPERSEQAATAAGAALTPVQLTYYLRDADLPDAIRLAEAAEGLVSLTAEQAKDIYQHHVGVLPKPAGLDQDLVSADRRAQLTSSLAVLASLRGPAVAAVFGDVVPRAEDAVASDPFGCTVAVEWRPASELGEPASVLERPWTFDTETACVVSAVAFARLENSVPPSTAYHARPGEDSADENAQAVHLGRRIFDACPEADLVKIEIWHAHAKPRLILGHSTGTWALRTGVLPRARYTSRNVARQAATAEAFGSENWTARCRAQAELAAELLVLLAELPSRLRPNDRASQREEWTQRVQHARELAAALPVRPSDATPLASTVQAAALAQTAADVDEALRRAENEDYARKALIQIANCLDQVGRSKADTQGVRGAGALLLQVMPDLHAGYRQGSPAYSGIGETLPAALGDVVAHAARLLSAVNEPLVAKALRSGARDPGRLSQILDETLQSALDDARHSVTQLLTGLDVSQLSFAVHPEPEPAPAWRTQQLVLGVPLVQWPDAVHALRGWDPAERESANVRCRISCVPVEDGEVLPMAIRISGAVGDALPISEDELPALAASLGLSLRRGDVQAVLDGPQVKLKEYSYALVRRAHRSPTWCADPAEMATPDSVANEITNAHSDLLRRKDEADKLPEPEQMKLLAVAATLELAELVATEDGRSPGLASYLAGIDVAKPAIPVGNEAAMMLNFALTAAIEADKTH